MDKKLSTDNIADLDIISNKLLLFDVNDKDLPEPKENFIQHKIDGKNLSQIKWSKLNSLFDQIIQEYNTLYYELRIYNAENEEENVSKILTKIKELAETLKCTCEIIKTKQGIFGLFFEFLIKPKENFDILLKKNTDNSTNFNNQKTKLIKAEVKFGVFGDESSGKSTTLSVLVNQTLDDGKGSMRVKNFRFQHEIQSGKTLSISHLMIGIDKNNNRVQYNNINEFFSNSDKIINLYDMGGSEKAMKNTLSLISPDYIDYSLLFVDAKNGPSENTKILYSLNQSVHIPVICIVTMADLFENNNKIAEFSDKLLKYLSSINSNIKPIFINKSSDILEYLSALNSHSYLGTSENILPIINISNVNGHNIPLLFELLTKLQNTLVRTIPLVNNYSKLNSPSTDMNVTKSKSDPTLSSTFNFIMSPQNQFDIHEHFQVDNLTIIGGIVSKGKIQKGQTYYFGPNKLGNFRKVQVQSIHCKKQEVDTIYEGQYSSLSLIGTNYDPSSVTKGMVLLDLNTAPKAVRKFKAELWWIGEENIKEIKYKIEPVVIINHIRQCCKIVYEEKVCKDFVTEEETTSEGEFSKSNSIYSCSVDDDFGSGWKRKKRKFKATGKEKTFFISRGEKIELVFEFKNSPEYIKEGANIIINDNSFKAFGIVTGALG